MIDLHTHILPGMDDGAKDVATSLAMLRMEKEQGVDAVALTPHFYRGKERIGDFLRRRADSLNILKSNIDSPEEFPRLIAGAEVAWASGLEDLPELRDLCYENTEFLLIELPFTPWNDEMFRQLYNFMIRTGLTPVIAHIERYFFCQKKAQIKELLEIGLPLQISAEPLLSPLNRGKALRILKENDAFLISDCHDCTNRPPNLGKGMEVLNKKLGGRMAEIIAERTDLLLEEVAG